MSKSKRRPGGGRKPIGEFAKSKQFTTRLEPAVRRALSEAAKLRDKSVSETAAHILREGLKRPSGVPHNLALACAIALIAEKIEHDAQKSWLSDQFTRQAMVYALETLLVRIAPDDVKVPPVPSAVEAAATRMPAPFADQFRTPDGFGYLLASNLINEIEQAVPGRLVTESSLPIFFSEKPMQLALIGRHLGLTAKRGKAT